MAAVLHHRVSAQPNLNKVLLWSLIGHVVILVLLSTSMTHRVKVSTPAIQVKLVGVPQPSAAKKVEPEKVRTQDSAAPKEPPPDPKNMPETDATSKFAIDQKDPTKDKKVNPMEAKERPPTLDKTPREKKVVKNDLDAKVVKNPEDFMESIDSFLEDAKPTTKPEPKAPAQDKPAGEGKTLQMNLSNQGVIDGIGAAVNKNWFFQGYDTKGLYVTVQVELGPDGKIVGLRVSRSSGNKPFDESLLRAIRKTDPLPIPADKLEEFRSFEMNFNPPS